MQSTSPFYSRLAAVFRDRIRTQVWPVGTMLPTIETLIAEFGAARNTVRGAIQLLVSEGVLESRRGRGTTVIASPDGLRAAGGLIRSEPDLQIDILDITEVDRPNVRSGPGATVERHLAIAKVHSRDGLPIASMTIYVPVALTAGLTRRDFVTRPVLDLLQEEIFAADNTIDQSLTIGAANRGEEQLLRIPIGDPVVRMERVVRNGDGRIVYAGTFSYIALGYELNFRASMRDVADGQSVRRVW